MGIVTQAIGGLATLLLILTYQVNDRRAILAFHICISICMTIHYGLLGALSGMVINIICMIRNVVFYNKDKYRWGSHPALPATVILAEIIATFFFWGGWIDVLALVGAPLQTAALWPKSTRIIRILMLIASPLWLIYDYYNGSWAGMVTESFVICSILIAMWKYDRKKS